MIYRFETTFGKDFGYTIIRAKGPNPFPNNNGYVAHILLSDVYQYQTQTVVAALYMTNWCVLCRKVILVTANT